MKFNITLSKTSETMLCILGLILLGLILLAISDKKCSLEPYVSIPTDNDKNNIDFIDAFEYVDTDDNFTEFYEELRGNYNMILNTQEDSGHDIINSILDNMSIYNINTSSYKEQEKKIHELKTSYLLMYLVAIAHIVFTPSEAYIDDELNEENKVHILKKFKSYFGEKITEQRLSDVFKNHVFVKEKYKTFLKLKKIYLDEYLQEEEEVV
jgi:hypothetical protein